MKAAHGECLVLGLALCLVGLPVWAVVVSGSGLIGSPHDFTRTATNLSGGGTKVCVFCHFQNSSANDVNLPLSFWSSGNQTHGGTRLPANLGTWAGSSKLCLSCHAAAGRQGRAPLWSGGRGGRTVATAVTAGSFRPVAPQMHETHPVGIPYPYLRVPGTYNQITTGQAVILSDYVPVPMNVKLFAATDNIVVAGARIGETGMECATCHDIHNEQVRDSRLLRNTKKQLCFDCHDL